MNFFDVLVAVGELNLEIIVFFRLLLFIPLTKSFVESFKMFWKWNNLVPNGVLFFDDIGHWSRTQFYRPYEWQLKKMYVYRIELELIDFRFFVHQIHLHKNRRFVIWFVWYMRIYAITQNPVMNRANWIYLIQPLRRCRSVVS